MALAVSVAQGRLSLPDDDESARTTPPNQLLPVGEKLSGVESILPKKTKEAEKIETKAENDKDKSKSNSSDAKFEKPWIVCVLDFASANTSSSEKNKAHASSEHNVPNEIHEANYKAEIDTNTFNRQKSKESLSAFIKEQKRSTVIGAEYLEAYLSKHSGDFVCLDRTQVSAQLKKFQSKQDFPADFFQKISEETGATHLIYGMVSDITTKESSFDGYGISSKITTSSLDVVIKVVDLSLQKIIHIGIYTGEYRTQAVNGQKEELSNVFQYLMKDALKKAADDIYQFALSEEQNKIQPETENYKTE